ncbi:hypothetical protein C5167_003787 [Papaver somniferum]|uniref:Uncharacterized protein n=1 Tax=Papaver somniferum TaxID=3469 RepID=A0A4Y7L2V5_PAPSO|nr:hypothetical protein C5167_003787 [Papaver somniferum]
MLIEKLIDEKLEGTPIDSSSERIFFQKSSTPGATNEERKVGYSSLTNFLIGNYTALLQRGTGK